MRTKDKSQNVLITGSQTYSDLERRSRRDWWDAVALSDKLGIHRTTLYRWVQRGDFPAPTYLTPTKPAWPDAVYRAWCDERVARSADARTAHKTSLKPDRP
ncbi:MAG: helix-turn-helix transcriptional regulator [Pseudorhodoplanes sp.]